MQKKLLLVLMVLVSLGLALLVLEWLYRSQLVDTYTPELHTFNLPQMLAPNAKPTLLVMGDSFSASRTSYAGILQDTLQEWRVINAAVSGTGVLQALYMAPKRFAQFHPSIFLYQVYVGNDLFDIRYPTNWRTISPVRNVYWFLANHLRVIGYLNYRLRQVKEILTSRQGHVLSLAGTAVATHLQPGTPEHSRSNTTIPGSNSMYALSHHCWKMPFSCKAIGSTTMLSSWRAWRNSSPTANRKCVVPTFWSCRTSVRWMQPISPI